MRLALLCFSICVGGGCQNVTGLLVTLRFESPRTFDEIVVDVLRDQSRIGGGNYQGQQGEPIADGSTFGVILRDSLDGSQVSVHVEGLLNHSQVEGVTSNPVTVQRQRVIPVDLIFPGADGGAPDLAGKDLETITCQSAIDVGAGGTFASTTVGQPDSTSGSCGGTGAPDRAFTFSIAQFTDVSLTVTQALGTTLYTRSGCNDPLTEVFQGGLCSGMLAFRKACIDNMSSPTQVLCGLPAGSYYTFVDGPTGSTGGAFSLSASFLPSALDDCRSAGFLGGPFPQMQMGDSSAKAGSKMSAPAATPSCGDLGATSPEMVYYVGAPNGGSRLQVEVASSAPSSYKPLLYLEQFCQPASVLCSDGVGLPGGRPSINLVNPSPGTFYIVVDGQQGTKGSFTLNVNLAP